MNKSLNNEDKKSYIRKLNFDTKDSLNKDR